MRRPGSTHRTSEPPFEPSDDARPWKRPRRHWLASDGAQAWLYVLAPVLVAMACVLTMRQLAGGNAPIRVHSELVGRLRASSSDIAAQLAAVANGRGLERVTLAGDLERMDAVLADAGALPNVPAWQASSVAPAGSLHLGQLLREWPEVREALLGAVGPLAGAGAARSSRDLAEQHVRSFTGAAEAFAADLGNFNRLEQRDRDARTGWLLATLVAALLAGAGLRAFDLLRLRRRQHELERLSLVAEGTGSSVLLADAGGIALWANDAFLRTSGWESVAGRPLAELILDGGSRPAAAALAGAIARQVPLNGEFELRRRGGQSFWAALELMPLFREGVADHQFMLMFTDISERVAATRALAASESRFRSALAALSEGLVLLDADGNVVQCNDSTWRILGLQPGQLLGTTPANRRLAFLAEDGRAVPPDAFPSVRALRGEPQQAIVLGFDRPAGDRVWLSVDASSFPIPGSDRPGVAVTFTDITARRAAEQSVRALTQVVEETPTMVMLTGEDNRIEYVNRAFEVCTGYGLADVRGRAPAFMLSELTPMETWDSLGRALAEGGYWRGEIHNLARDGTVWLADSQVFALRAPDGRVTHYAAMLRDITEQRRREHELATAREAALDAARAKTEFLQNVSHELRTPLNGIMGMSELLLNSGLDAAQRADVVQLRNSADELLSVVTHLFDFVQVEAKTAQESPQPFRLRSALEEVERTLGAAAEARGLAWSLIVDGGVPDGLVGDPGRLRRVLLNLASNAVKFTERGEVSLRVGLVRMTGETATIRFGMRDTGIGIPAERQAGIFEAFVQVDGSSTRRYGGIGLGLALASRLVGQMGGQLGLQSQPGAGSTFSFELEFGRAAGDAGTVEAVLAHAGLPPLAGVHVLVAAGGASLRTSTRVALQRAGVDILGVLDAPELGPALARLLAEGLPVTALVIDQRDARLDGFALVEALRDAVADPPPVILLTSAGQRGDAARCRDLGIAAYLSAPAGETELVETLGHVLASHAGGASGLVTRHSLREAHCHHRVLLVDDNAVNRKVASRLLERSGYEVVTAVDGREGVERFLEGGWDAVLMDVQMPGMDGVEATRHIRAHEHAHGLARTPVVALTAHTLDADRRAVLDAGMDDLVPKPIQPDELVAALQRHLVLAPGAGPEIGGGPELADVLDRAEALERMEGDEELFHELLRIFRGDADEMWKRLAAADAAADARQLERAAHSLKGASGTISARHVCSLATEIERLAREDRVTEARDRMPDLRREFRQLVRALESVPQREAA